MKKARGFFHTVLSCTAIVLGLLPTALQAQSIGQLHCDNRIFSTGLPNMDDYAFDYDDGPKMSRERREIALECVEWTFGKVKEYKEWWNECQGCHVLTVTLESGDKFSFYDGRLTRFSIVSSRFTVGADVLRGGGLKVGQKLNLKKSRGTWEIRPAATKEEPGRYKFSPEMDDYYLSYFVIDENGRIVLIYNWTNDC